MAKQEKTGLQVVGVPQLTEPRLPNVQLGRISYQKIREMRRDPTIHLAREIVIAPVLAADWSVESTLNAPNGGKIFIDKVMMPFRTHILRTSLYGCIDFGWQSYEKVLKVRKIKLQTGRTEQFVVVDKLKPLIPDITMILVDIKTGAYAGLEQFPYSGPGGDNVILRKKDTLLLNIDVEGTNWYGEGLMENAEAPYDQWNNANESASRYDTKIAGAQWIIKYPYGTSTYNGVKDVDNAEVAKDLIRQLRASGAIAIPRRIEDVVDSLNGESPDAWEIELISDKGAGVTQFIDRLHYIDALKVRALNLPEKAVLEGKYGVKSESDTYADLGILAMELRHKVLVEEINRLLVNDLLTINFGEKYKDTVYIVAAPIADVRRTFLQQVYRAFLNNPEILTNEYNITDMEAMKDSLGVPLLPQFEADRPLSSKAVSPATEGNGNGRPQGISGYDPVVDQKDGGTAPQARSGGRLGNQSGI